MDIQPLLADLESAIARAQALAERCGLDPDPELEATLVALQQALLDAKRRCLTLQQDFEGLEAQLAACDQIAREHGLYWRFIGEKKIAGPFCPNCYEAQQALIKLQYHPGGIGRHAKAAYYECARCGSRFEP